MVETDEFKKKDWISNYRYLETLRKSCQCYYISSWQIMGIRL